MAFLKTKRKHAKKKTRKADKKIVAQGSKGNLALKIGIAEGAAFQADGRASLRVVQQLLKRAIQIPFIGGDFPEDRPITIAPFSSSPGLTNPIAPLPFCR